MKILMLAPQPFFEPRGAPLLVLWRLRALSQLGHDVDLLTYHVGQDVSIPGVVIHRTLNISLIKTVKIGPSPTKLFLDVLLFINAFRLLRKGSYELLHTNEEASFFGILLAKLFGIRHLYDMHSSLPEMMKNFPYARFGPLVRLFDWLEHKAIDSSDAIITFLHEAYLEREPDPVRTLEPFERFRASNVLIDQYSFIEAETDDDGFLQARVVLPTGDEITLVVTPAELLFGVDREAYKLVLNACREAAEEASDLDDLSDNEDVA